MTIHNYRAGYIVMDYIILLLYSYILTTVHTCMYIPLVVGGSFMAPAIMILTIKLIILDFD